MTVDDAAWCRCTPGEQRSARAKLGGRGTRGYSRHTLLGTGQHAEQLLKAKLLTSGAWLRDQMSVYGSCAQIEGALIFSQQEERTQCLQGKQADVRAQGLAQGRRASTCRSRLLHVGRGRGGRRHAPGGAAITQHHRCTETGEAHAQMANVQPREATCKARGSACAGGRGCQSLVAKSRHVRFHQSKHQRRREWQHKRMVCSKCHTR